MPQIPLLERRGTCGWGGIEEYAREVFPVEEANNGLTWMKEVEPDDDEDDDATG